MEAEKEPLGIRSEFKQGDPENVKGKAFVYSAGSNGLIAVFAAQNLIEFKERKLVPLYQIFDINSRPTFLAADFPAKKEEDLFGGLEDVIKIEDLKEGTPGIKLVLAGLLHYSNLAEEQLQGKSPASSVVRRVRRYYEVDTSDFVGYVKDMFVDPILEALSVNDQQTIDRRMDELRRFSHGSPFVDTVEEFRKYIRSTAVIPEIDVIVMYIGLMNAKLNMEKASQDDSQLEAAAKFRDEVRALSAGIERSKTK